MCTMTKSPPTAVDQLDGKGMHCTQVGSGDSAQQSPSRPNQSRPLAWLTSMSFTLPNASGANRADP
ncbi:hypothetical protein BCR44DRAFT_1444382 [Catenaria anguillulae PL171]|uniref:Uncharacterized protein n=1 Tax=Catenaria anguillulae PL171 TaxID=765915 RepID=A0A1Y2H7M3_9FUNG|nr:hypothetical protein BCR44DRAFT_1444382 [Catenaria anguillulae PL171]